MSGNLPPGVSTADIDRHFGGPSHEHEWAPVDDAYPILEDLAALVHEQCIWAEVVDSYTDHGRDETYYEYGGECDETRYRRFDLSYVRVLTGDGPRNHQYDRQYIDQLIAQDASIVEPILEIVSTVERAFPEEVGAIDLDPSPRNGRVVIQHGGYELCYEPGVNGGE